MSHEVVARGNRVGDPRRGGVRRLRGIDGGITVRFGTEALVKRGDHLHSRSRSPGVAAVALRDAIDPRWLEKED